MEHGKTKNCENESNNENEGNVNVLLRTIGNNKKIKLSAQSCKVKFNTELNVEKDCENQNKIHLKIPELKKLSTKSRVIQSDENVRENKEICNIQNSQDYFDIHFNYDLLHNPYFDVLNKNSIFETYLLQWPVLGNIIVSIPEYSLQTMSLSKRKLKQFRTSENENYVPLIKVKKILTLLQNEVFSVINNYQDLLYCEKNFCNDNEIMYIYCLHAINHILKAQSRILEHTVKLSKPLNTSEKELFDEYRDQGLVKPKVLIIVPFRHTCLKIVEMLITVLFGDSQSKSVINKNRFMNEFGGDTIFMPKTNPKPEDYEQTFSGNTDDTFKIGISIKKKTLKLYSKFYSSDIIIASALGLRMLIGADGEEDRDYDFLASIELLILDQTDVILMQNWDHLIHVLNHLHLQPRKSHGTDYSRVRSWCVNGLSKYYQQTLIFSSIHAPEMHALFNKKFVNYAGRVKVMNTIQIGSINQVIVNLPQVFVKFDASNYVQAIKARFEVFVTKILPHFKNNVMNHTLIYIPSYFDYVKLRNYFKKTELSFVQICEYSKDAKVARARDMFFHNHAHFLLYSERFHFFRRINIKGIRHIIFFAPPSFPHFYSELCNLMYGLNQNSSSGSESNMTITTLYSKYDAMRLSAILGTNRTAKIIESEKCIHTIVTGK